MAVLSERFSKPYLVGKKPLSSMPFINFSSIKLPLSRSLHCRRRCGHLLHCRRYPLKVSCFPLLLLAIGTQFISSIPFASSLSLNSLSPVSSSPLSCSRQLAETKEMYGFSIQHTHLPCLQVGNQKKANYLPMEACKFVEGQQYTKRINERQISLRSKVTCQRLKDQENGIIRVRDETTRGSLANKIYRLGDPTIRLENDFFAAAGADFEDIGAQEQRKMSLSGRVDTDIEINIPAKEFHEIYTTKQSERGKMSPQSVTSCELLEGEWGKPGSVFLWKFDDDGVIELTKEQLEEVDNENFTSTVKVLEGEILKSFKSLIIFSKVTPKGEGCVVNFALEYEKISDDIGDPQLAYLDAFVVMTKDIAAYVTKQ